MYACFKSCVRFNNECTNTFDCPVGLRQGCLFSPVIFSIFVNELSKLIANSDIFGIQLFPDITEILLFLFADDIALMADSIRGLQKQINITEKFCVTYKMVGNTVKTEVMVFRRGGRLRKNEKILYKGNELDIRSLCWPPLHSKFFSISKDGRLIKERKTNINIDFKLFTFAWNTV